MPGEKFPNRLPTCVIGVTQQWLAPHRSPCREWLKRGLPKLEVAVPSRTDLTRRYGKDVLVTVIIGMDPHKRSATIEVIDPTGTVLATGRYSTDNAGYGEMLTAAQRYADRVWAIGGCNEHRSTYRAPAGPRRRDRNRRARLGRSQTCASAANALRSPDEPASTCIGTL